MEGAQAQHRTLPHGLLQFGGDRQESWPRPWWARPGPLCFLSCLLLPGGKVAASKESEERPPGAERPSPLQHFLQGSCFLCLSHSHMLRPGSPAAPIPVSAGAWSVWVLGPPKEAWAGEGVGVALLDRRK